MRRELIIKQAFILAILALFPAILSAFFHPKRPSWDPEALGAGEIRLATVLNWKENVLWVDARPRKDFEKSHIPSAKLLNEDEWNALAPNFLKEWMPGKFVVVYCDDLKCHSSQRVAERLRELGVERVFVLKGGWQTWLDANK